MLQDSTPTLWFAEDGARIGRFLGHKGAVNTCDLTCTLRDCRLIWTKARQLENLCLACRGLQHPDHGQLRQQGQAVGRADRGVQVHL